MGEGQKLLSRSLTSRGLRHHWDLVSLIDGNNADILVPLLLQQGHILGAVNVTETVNFEELVWDVHQVLVDNGLWCLRALPAQLR